MDPIADQFAWVSTFNYAENEPIANIDLWGLQKISVNDKRNSSSDPGHTPDGNGLMGAKINGQLNIDKAALKLMYQGMAVTGRTSSQQINYSNNKENAKEFFTKFAIAYDKGKTRKAAVN